MKYKFYKTKIDGKRRCQTRTQTYNPRGFAHSRQAQSAYTISIGGKGYQKQRASMETRTTSITERGALSMAMGRAPPKQIQRRMSIWHLAQGAYSYLAQGASAPPIFLTNIVQKLCFWARPCWTYFGTCSTYVEVEQS